MLRLVRMGFADPPCFTDGAGRGAGGETAEARVAGRADGRLRGVGERRQRASRRRCSCASRCGSSPSLPVCGGWCSCRPGSTRSRSSGSRSCASLAVAAVYYLFGRRYGDRAVRWLESKMGGVVAADPLDRAPVPPGPLRGDLPPAGRTLRLAARRRRPDAGAGVLRDDRRSASSPACCSSGVVAGELTDVILQVTDWVAANQIWLTGVSVASVVALRPLEPALRAHRDRVGRRDRRGARRDLSQLLLNFRAHHGTTTPRGAASRVGSALRAEGASASG